MQNSLCYYLSSSFLPFPLLLLLLSIHVFGFHFCYFCLIFYYCQISVFTGLSHFMLLRQTVAFLHINYTNVEEKDMCLWFKCAALLELVRDCTGHTTQGPVSVIKFTSFISYILGIIDGFSFIDLGRFTLASLLICYFYKNKVIFYYFFLFCYCLPCYRGLFHMQLLAINFAKHNLGCWFGSTSVRYSR